MDTELQLVGSKSWGATTQPGDHTHRGALHISELDNRIYKVPPINKCWLRSWDPNLNIILYNVYNTNVAHFIPLCIS